MGRQAWFLDRLWSSYLYINSKKNDYDRFYIFLKDLRIFDPSKFFPVTRSLVSLLLVTSLNRVVTLIANSNFHTYYSHFKQMPGIVATYKQKQIYLYSGSRFPRFPYAQYDYQYHRVKCKILLCHSYKSSQY